MLVKDDGTNGATVEVKSDNFTIKEGAVHVISGAETTNLKFTGQTGLVKGNLLVDDKGVFDISAQTTVAEGETEPAGLGTVTLADGSNTVVSGSINVNNGTLIVKDGATLQASKAGATINVNANSGANPATAGTLQISKAELDAYLKGGAENQYHAITAATGAVAEGLTDGASGAVMLSGGRLELTGDENIDLATSFNFSGTTSTATAGLINVNTSAAATIYAKNMTLSKALTKNGSDPAGTTSLMLDAETLTLGKAGESLAAVTDFGFSGATAQNFEAAGTGLVLNNQVNLSAVREVTQNGQVIIEGDTGTITGDFTVSGGASKGLTIEHGSYTNDGNITVSGGTLKVTNSAVGENSDQYVDTRWEVTGALTLQAASNSKVVVDGANTDDHGVETVLDITGVNKLTIGNAASADVEVDVQSGGTLVLTGNQLTTLLHDFSTEQANKSGSKVLLNDGLIQVEGDVTLAATQLSGSDTAALHKLSFHTTNGGTLEVDGTLKLTGVNALSLGGESGAIVANILNLNNTTSAASLTSGSYTALSSLTSDTPAVGVEVGDTATVNLGRIDTVYEDDGTMPDYYVANGGGSLSTDLKITHEDGSVNVVAGDWTGGRDITVTKGTLTVGDLYNGAAYLDADGEAITASLALGNLDIGTEATAKVIVNETGTLTTNGFKAANTNALTVNGSVTVNGVKPGDKEQNPTYGINVGEGSVQVNAGGLLRLDGYAVTALGNTKADSATPDAFFTTASNSYKAGGITVNAGGEVYINFAEDTSLSAEALKDLRAAIFATQTDGTVAGSINIGAATISGIEPDPADGKYDS